MNRTLSQVARIEGLIESTLLRTRFFYGSHSVDGKFHDHSIDVGCDELVDDNKCVSLMYPLEVE